MRFSELEGEKVAIWGFGLEGKAVAAELDRRDIAYVVVPNDTVPAAMEELGAATVVVKSPGIPRTSSLYRHLDDGTRAITSLSDLWLSDNAHRTIGVTGTKGKSTTSALIHHLLVHLGQESVLLGNIGVSLMEDPGTGTAVVELSSYQAQSLTVSPRIAVVTSLFPEHLPWHGSVEAYYADKLHLLDFTPERVVWPGDDELLSELIAQHVSGSQLCPVTGDGPHVELDAIVWPGIGSIDGSELALAGAHNLRNAAVALQTVFATGLLDDPVTALTALDGLRTFEPLPHRFEPVASSDDREWIDDGLATTPESVVAALRALPTRQVAALVGGADRGLDYTVLLDFLAGRPDVMLLLTGPVGERVGAEAAIRGLPHKWFESMRDAMAWARTDHNRSDVVLLSPGAPSFDEFVDYKDRSAAFRAAALRR